MSIRACSARLAAALLLTSLAGCGSSASPKAAPSASTISIKGYAFLPASSTVALGARVTWINHDATAHTATAAGQGFDTGSLQPGQSRTITLSKSGTYAYYCAFHAFMRARITVVK